ncbi:MAG TPA: acyl-CoA dehydratase activase [Rubneribacter badeniensis]|uniref:Acyl-CoA dehydratase activase n=1 Tax=Rubneribacter badeniensis TaxID=2070688 RepID=A0A9D2VLE7_9ACTN|nr:acyl-CoA dehydratase activase [Rubneribacter badeniensis]
MTDRYTVGIEAGAASVKLAALAESGELAWTWRRAHKGDVAACLREGMAALASALPPEGCAGFMLTGGGAALVRERFPEAPVLEDVPALTRGAALLAPEARSIVCLGAQNAFFVTGFADGAPPRFAMNEGCAAGTGSFFEDQMGRLGLPLEEYSALVGRAQSVPRLSGRCSVFAKTDIIHRQQEGVAVEDILLGLCFAVVKSFKATIVRGLPVDAPVLLTGGALLNAGVVRAVREVFKLGEGELVAREECLFAQAAGAAAAAWDAARAGEAGGGALLDDLRTALGAAAAQGDLPRLDALPSAPLDSGPGFRALPRPWPADADGLTPCILGVDVGSTSTNLVLLDEEGRLLDAQYLRTRGNPQQAVREGLASLRERLGAEVRVAAVGVTGSGRTLIGELIGADAVRDEITAQARAAVAADPLADTVFEIGGQDSKYIALANGQVADFQMNKVCAAGTGSFVEEQAARLGIPLGEYGALALSAKTPVDLGERCTVFVETAIHAALAKGASRADIAAGLALSIVRNYLNKVVGGKPVGRRVVLQGGVAYNPAIVAAFRQFYGEALTVSPWFAVSGAVGAALLARELLHAGGLPEGTAFRGFSLERPARVRRAVSREEVAANRAFFRKSAALYLEGYDPTIDPGKKTVGIPRCLMLHKLFPLANAFFRQLGYNVVLTDASTEDTVRLAQQEAQGEVCYPVKLVYGHMEQLARRGVDYIFKPSMHTIRHVRSKVAHNYACPYMQVAPRMVARALRLEERGVTLVSPLMNMDFGQEALAEALLGVGAQLGHTPEESARAMMAGGFAVQEFTRKTEALGEELLGSLAPGERVLVLVTRQYNTADPALNMNIADALIDRGQKVITVSHLHAHDLDISADHPRMYWPFGQHLLSGAKLVRCDPRLFAVYLTNHGCGPDTMVSHLFAEEMGDKPYLHIEMDEHYSKVGVITRIEAFLNALDHYEAPDERALPLAARPVADARTPVDPARPCALPAVGPYGELAAAWLARRVDAEAQGTSGGDGAAASQGEGADAAARKDAAGAAAHGERAGERGLDVRLLRPTEESLAAARKELSTKEYYTFATLLGLSLAATAPAVSFPASNAAAGTIQLLLPSSEGAEADGQYDRVIRSILERTGRRDVRIVAPSLEKLPWAVNDAAGLFTALLAGDVCLAAPQEERASLLRDLLSESLTPKRVREAAVDVGRRADVSRETSAARTLAVVGEWPCVCGDELTGGLWERLEREGFRLLRMPLAEYLLFLWRDAADEDARERSRKQFFLDQVSPKAVLDMPSLDSCDCAARGSCDASCGASGVGERATSGVGEHAAFEEVSRETSESAALLSASAPAPIPAKPAEPPYEEKLAVLDAYERQLREVHRLLGSASPYSEGIDALREAAEKALGSYRGANGRYRAAKERLMAPRVNGIITAASMYENTDIVLKLLEDPAGAPVLRLSFDGTLDQSVEEKLRSFLYYL